MGQHRIHLTRDLEGFRLDVPDGSLCVHHRTYPAPAIGCDTVPFGEFEAAPRRWLRGRPALVFAGLNKAMTPSSRTREVWEILFNATPGLLKISVDRTLFVSEPWRAWFHFGFVGEKYREFTYSYLAESHWKAHREGLRDEDPFSVGEFARWGRGVVVSDRDRFFGAVDVRVVETTAAAKAEYAELKAAAFDEERTLPAIVRRLSTFAQGACPARLIPTPARLFLKAEHHIVRTDLAVDRFLVDNTLGLVRLTNAIASEFNGAG